MKFKLPKQVKQKWVKALRSGDYKQAQFKLYDRATRSHCCLGVARACKLVKPNKKLAKDGEVDYSFLPEKVQNTLINFNDSRKYSFDRIANWIEKHL